MNNHYQITGSTLEDSEINNYVLDQDSTDREADHDQGEYTGFCVYGRKICIYGNNGLFTATVSLE